MTLFAKELSILSVSFSFHFKEPGKGQRYDYKVGDRDGMHLEYLQNTYVYM